MKKLSVLFLAAVMMISLIGCSSVAANPVNSIDDLPGKTIGVQLGTTGDIYASDYESEGSTIERYNKTNDAVAALKQGKIDCIIIDDMPAQVFVEKNTDLKILEEPFALEEYAICVAKENAELKDAINGALASLKADGTLDKIIANYVGDDDVKGTFKYESTNTDFSGGQLIMATEATFPPYEYYDSDTIVGLDVDMAQAVADMLKMELVVENMDFNAIITAVQTGKANVGIAGLTITEERLQNVDFTDPYTTATQVIVVRAK